MPEQASWRRDLAIAVVGLTALLILPFLWQSTALVDFVIRIAALGLFATSLNLLIGYAGMVSFGHGLFFGLGAYSFGLMMQKLGTSIPVAFALTLAVNATFAALLGIRLDEISHLYAFSCVLLVAGLLIMRHIVESPFGYTLRLVRDNTERATFLGIDVFRVKLAAFVIAGVIAGLGALILMFVLGLRKGLVDFVLEKVRSLRTERSPA